MGTELSYKILDEVLKVVRSITPETPQSSEIIFQNFPNSQTSEFNTYRYAILMKLKKDGFIDCMISNPSTPYPPNTTLYFVTFEGLLLLKDEGYEGRRRKDQSSKRFQFIQTWVIAIGTFLAAVFSGILLFRHH